MMNNIELNDEQPWPIDFLTRHWDESGNICDSEGEYCFTRKVDDDFQDQIKNFPWLTDEYCKIRAVLMQRASNHWIEPR